MTQIDADENNMSETSSDAVFAITELEMTALSLRLPQSLHQKVSELAEREGISINQLISSAVAEKMSALMTEDYLNARAARGSRRKFEAALAKVPDVAPDANDEMPPGRKSRRKTQTS